MVAPSPGLEAFDATREMDLLRQRMRADRSRSDKERLELLSAMQEAMSEARKRQAEQEAAMRRQGAFLRRCRLEADAAKAAFEADVRRRQAYFDQSAAHAEERAERREEQRRRSERSQEYGLSMVGSMHSQLIETVQQERTYAAFEASFQAFEEAPADVPSFAMTSIPWPPAGCPVSGVRRGDSAERRKQLLKAALLRWHPDKFAAAHGSKLEPAEADAIMEKVTAVLRRVQAERAACADADDAEMTGGGGAASAASGAAASSEARRAAAAAASRYVPAKARMPTTRATGPKVVRPSRAGTAAAASDPAVNLGPRSQKYVYEGRYQ